MESDAVIAILSRCLYGSWELAGSDIIEHEIMKTPDLGKRNRALVLYSISKKHIAINDFIIERATEARKYGIKPMDGLHLASAEYGNADVLLTVDKEFLIGAKRIGTSLKVANPVNWLMEAFEND